jgi:GWxTD domain-containing protein
VKKIFFALFMFMTSIFLYAGIAQKSKDLPSAYKKWLEEDVAYIITPVEKEVFLKLQTDRERDLFIEAFWKHRDPIAATPENEFKTEHYRRINYANHFFGRGMPKPGWKTDRGRVYIILGEPNDIQRFEGKTTVCPTEVWFYQGKTNVGLPPGFHLIFFQEGGTGEYRLYSPLRDGPQALMPSYHGDPMDYLAAYKQLEELEPALAEVSLSLIPGEDSVVSGHPTMSSDILIQNVETVPVRQVEDKYVRKFLEYKDVVEVEYSANYIDSDSLVRVFRDPSGMYFVHYGIELRRLSVEQFEKKYYARLKLNGKVSSLNGKTIYQFEKNISLDFDEEQIRNVSRQPLIIHDMFPLVSGNYKFSLLVKNEASKEFTSLEEDLIVPQGEKDLQMTPIVLGYRLKKSPSTLNKLRPFALGSYQVYFEPNRIFLRTDTLGLAFQVQGLSEDLKQKGIIRISFIKSGGVFRTTDRKITELSELPDVIEQFSLQDFPAAHYKVEVSLFGGDKELLLETEEFDVTPLEAIPRPWVYSKILLEPEDPLYSYIIGTQLFNSGRVAEAKAALEEAHEKKPDSADIALSLAQTYMVLNEYVKIEQVLLPFLSQPEPPKYKVFLILGRAYQSTGNFQKAVEIFDKAVSHYGLSTDLLNAIGECYFKLGELGEAQAAWKKSLELNPDQPQVKKVLEVIKEKNKGLSG